jgi:hypothetical protein
MMDGSSLGNDYEAFLQTYQGIEDAMDIVVNGIYRVMRLSWHIQQLHQ